MQRVREKARITMQRARFFRFTPSDPEPDGIGSAPAAAASIFCFVDAAFVGVPPASLARTPLTGAAGSTAASAAEIDDEPAPCDDELPPCENMLSTLGTPCAPPFAKRALAVPAPIFFPGPAWRGPPCPFVIGERSEPKKIVWPDRPVAFLRRTALLLLSAILLATWGFSRK